MEKRSPFKKIKKTMVFFILSFALSFYFLEVFIEQSVYGREVDLSGSLFLFSLTHPFNHYGLPLLLSSMTHISWTHFFLNTSLFLVFSSQVELKTTSRQWFVLTTFSHLSVLSICALLAFFISPQAEHFLAGSSVIVFALLGFLFKFSKNNWLIPMALIFLIVHFLFSGPNLVTGFSLTAHGLGLLFGFVSPKFLKLRS